ncbi:MAG TPA: hypothetical protein VI076_14550 [Actinopolymorphaceae bacterium]
MFGVAVDREEVNLPAPTRLVDVEVVATAVPDLGVSTARGDRGVVALCEGRGVVLPHQPEAADQLHGIRPWPVAGPPRVGSQTVHVDRVRVDETVFPVVVDRDRMRASAGSVGHRSAERVPAFAYPREIGDVVGFLPQDDIGHRGKPDEPHDQRRGRHRQRYGGALLECA